jgi:hypothetical protein
VKGSVTGQISISVFEKMNWQKRKTEIKASRARITPHHFFFLKKDGEIIFWEGNEGFSSGKVVGRPTSGGCPGGKMSNIFCGIILVYHLFQNRSNSSYT